MSVESYGSSPRGRGTVRAIGAGRAVRRFIPAWAGNSSTTTLTKTIPSVHPRVGGEQGFLKALPAWETGSSPRGRGTVQSAPPVWSRCRFIPAWAGNSIRKSHKTRVRPVHPRVGGEQLQATLSRRDGGGSSPRGRGTVVARAKYSEPVRFIPAWAGNSIRKSHKTAVRAVHPRVGGEQL